MINIIIILDNYYNNNINKNNNNNNNYNIIYVIAEYIIGVLKYSCIQYKALSHLFSFTTNYLSIFIKSYYLILK